MNQIKQVATGLAGILFFSLPAKAQLNMAALQDPHNSNNAAHYMPTFLGDGVKGWQVTLANPYVTVGSNFTTARDVRDYLSSDEISNEMVGRTIGKLKSKDNIMQAGLDLAIVNAVINIPDKSGQPFLSIGFGANERVEMSTVFNKELFQLAYQGNKQFAGQTISLAPRLNALAYTDYYVSAAAEFKIPATEISIKPAVRLRYLSGQASVYMPKSNLITMYTEPDGRYLDFGLNYEINTSLSGDDTVSLSSSAISLDRKNFRQGAGKGFGMDFGVRVSPMENLSVNIGFTDLGSLRFSKNAVNMSNDTIYRYEGEEITFSDNGHITLDSIAGIAEPKYTYNSYRVKLPSKFTIAASLGLGKAEHKNLSYYRHNLTFVYLQGFDNYLSATKKPYVALGYTHSFNDVVNLGANASVGGLWGSGIGALMSFKFGFFRVGVSSNNLLPLIAPKSGKGTDVGLMLAFGR